MDQQQYNHSFITPIAARLARNHDSLKFNGWNVPGLDLLPVNLILRALRRTVLLLHSSLLTWVILVTMACGCGEALIIRQIMSHDYHFLVLLRAKSYHFCILIILPLN
jgi:hypothetical protein